MTHTPETITNSDHVFNLIEQIANTPGKNDKIGLLKGAIDAELVLRVLVASHDPYITYGIKKRPAIDQFGSKYFDDVTWVLLEDLANRELTGNAAITALEEELSVLTENSSELLWRIINKDLRAGFGESSINKAKKGTIKTFPYMRCSLQKDAKLDEWPWDRGVISQEKADGMFANIDNEKSGVVNISSRQGSLFPSDKFANIVEEMQSRMSKGYQYHGEIVVYRDGKLCERQDGNGVLNHILGGGDFAENEKPVYMMWDAIPLSEVKPKGKYKERYATRLKQIVDDLKDTKGVSLELIETKIFKSLPAAMGHFTDLLAQGKEGTIIKHPDAIWKDGKSKEQIKLKLEVDVDLIVKGINEGKAGTRVEGRPAALVCESSDGLLKVDVTVKNEAMRDHVEANPDEWLDSIIAVRANEVLKPSESNELHSLFLPRMVEANYRTDKSEADTLQEVIDQFDAAKRGE